MSTKRHGVRPDPVAERVRALGRAFSRRLMHLGLARDEDINALLAGFDGIAQAVHDLEMAAQRDRKRAERQHDSTDTL